MSYDCIDFMCPKCGGDTLSLMQTVDEFVEVTHIDVKSQTLEYGDTLDGRVTARLNWACHSCGLVIGKTEKEAAVWLTNNAVIKWRG